MARIDSSNVRTRIIYPTTPPSPLPSPTDRPTSAYIMNLAIFCTRHAGLYGCTQMQSTRGEIRFQIIPSAVTGKKKRSTYIPYCLFFFRYIFLLKKSWKREGGRGSRTFTNRASYGITVYVRTINLDRRGVNFERLK